MSYTKFRYIGYRVPTVGVFLESGESEDSREFLEMPSGDAKKLERYIKNGFPAEIKGISNSDAQNRVARVWSALLDAQEIIKKLGDDELTLKIFLAPEFYFRPTTEDSTTTPKGPSYTLKEYSEIKSALRTLIHSELFLNWIVVPGTIMWSGTGKIGKRPDTIPEETIFFNTALIIKNGPILNTQLDKRVIEKAVTSKIDGLPTLYHGKSGEDAYKNKATDEAWLYYQTPEKIRKHIFKHEGVTLSLEICVEHLLGLLKNSLRNWPDLSDKNNEISIELIIGAGAPIKREFVTAKKGGYVLWTDGYGPLKLIRTDLRVIKDYRNKDFGQGLSVPLNHIPSFAVFDESDESDESEDSNKIEHTIDLQNDGKVPRPIGTYSPKYYFKQVLEIYKTRTLT